MRVNDIPKVSVYCHMNISSLSHITNLRFRDFLAVFFSVCASLARNITHRCFFKCSIYTMRNQQREYQNVKRGAAEKDGLCVTNAIRRIIVTWKRATFSTLRKKLNFGQIRRHSVRFLLHTACEDMFTCWKHLFRVPGPIDRVILKTFVQELITLNKKISKFYSNLFLHCNLFLARGLRLSSFNR